MTKIRSHWRLALVAAACGAFLCACSSTSTREPVDLEKFTETMKVEKVWSVSLGENPTGLLTPKVTETGIYAAGSNTLYRINPETGEEVWKVKLDSSAVAGVGSDGHTVALSIASGELLAFDESGKELWRVKLTSELTVPPLVGSGIVVVRTSDTRVSCYDALTGERRWRYQGQAPALSLRVARELRFSPAGILVGQSNGRLLALDGQGQPVFDVPGAQAKGTTEVDRLVVVVGAPLVDSHMMCASAYQGNVLCISSENGRFLWAKPVDAVSGPISDGTNVYITAANGEIHAFDYASGTPRWTNKEYHWRSPSAVVVTPEAVAFCDYDGVVSFLDPITGKTIARTSVGGAVKSIPVSLSGGALFQTDEGHLTFIRAQNQK